MQFTIHRQGKDNLFYSLDFVADTPQAALDQCMADEFGKRKTPVGWSAADGKRDARGLRLEALANGRTIEMVGDKYIAKIPGQPLAEAAINAAGSLTVGSTTIHSDGTLTANMPAAVAATKEYTNGNQWQDDVANAAMVKRDGPAKAVRTPNPNVQAAPANKVKPNPFAQFVNPDLARGSHLVNPTHATAAVRS